MLRKALVCLVLMLAALPAVSDSTLFATGFEVPDYTAGDITGQQGWQTNSTNFTVTALPDFVIEGSQSMLVTGGAGRLGRHAITGATSWMRIEVKMAKAMVNTGQWWVALQKADGTGRSAVFGFNGGNIQYHKGATGWTTYSTFSAATAYSFRAEANIAAATWSLWVNGNLVEANMPTYSSTPATPEEVYFYRGYLSLTGQPAYANYAVADALSIKAIPEPASVMTLLVGLGGIAGYVRRRR